MHAGGPVHVSAADEDTYSSKESTRDHVDT